MTSVNRRRFLQLGSLGAGLAVPAGLRSPVSASGQPRAGRQASTYRRVRLSGDGLGLSPVDYAALLHRLLDEKGIVPDSYSLGGVVEELEEQCARILGKERAIFMPTGTLANHMAVRALAGGSSRVIVQEDSHLYQDEGDCAQTLSNLTLMPLAAGRATFTADDLQRVLDQTKGGRVVSRVSAISIETPVRRKQGERFDPGRARQDRRHRAPRGHPPPSRRCAPVSRGRRTPAKDVADYSRPFDTVYVSLYKYFNAASGAILAGPRELIDGMYHGRRMFGGGLNHVWPFALVALHYLGGFERPLRPGRADVRGLDPRAPAARSLHDRPGSAGHESVPAPGARDRIRPRSGSASRRAACSSPRRSATRSSSASTKR